MTVLESINDKSWLSWAGDELMPHLAQIAHEEEDARMQEEAAEAVQRVEAAKEAEAEVARAAQVWSDDARGAKLLAKTTKLIQQFQAKIITAAQLQDATAALENYESEEDIECDIFDNLVSMGSSNLKRKDRDDDEQEGNPGRKGGKVSPTVAISH